MNNLVISNDIILSSKEIQNLHDLINHIYLTSEREFWKEGYERIPASELIKINQEKKLFVARVNNEIVACLRYGVVKTGVSNFSMLCVSPNHRKEGVALKLLLEAEEFARMEGSRTMQLELLLPKEFRHPEKEMLKVWYSKLNYKKVNDGNFIDFYPEVVSLMKIDCEFQIWEKVL